MTAHVHTEGDDVYDVMLNQTNLQFNNNKYYQIQLLKDDDSNVYTVQTRWGRVGYKGQSQVIDCGGDLEEAKKVFKDKFLKKTMNHWEKRRNFVKVDGKYDMVSRDQVEHRNTDEQPSELDDRIQSLLDLICDPEAMEKCLKEMKFDIKKVPLGELTSKQIRAGYEALKIIEECLKKKASNQELVEASDTFYTRIPHDFGFKKPLIINTEDELKEKIALLETLRNIEIAVKIFQSIKNSDERPLESYYQFLQYKPQPLASSSREYQVIEKYLQTTQGEYNMTIVDIFSVDRNGESSNFLSQLDNRTLLWHGSRICNFFGILHEGLLVAPTVAQSNGSNFGKGIYFADMSTESAFYCHPDPNNPVGLLLLCEVALGECNELQEPDPEASNLPPGKHSTKALGRIIPDPNNSVPLHDVIVPMGPGVTREGYSLLYNEYVVYDPARVRMRYLLRIRFN